MSDQRDGSQGQLFSDAAVGAPPYDEVDTDLVGYRGPTACAAAGITYRQLDYWARTGLVAPSVRSATGSGTQRLYSFRDILVLKVVKRLLDTGVSLQNIRKAVDHLRTRGIKDLANVTLFSDGATVYECTSAEEVVDLLAGGQGVFGIAVSGALRELSGELAELPAERLDGGPVHSADDELSMRRRRRAAVLSVVLRTTPRPGAVPRTAELLRHPCAEPSGPHSARPFVVAYVPPAHWYRPSTGRRFRDPPAAGRVASLPDVPEPGGGLRRPAHRPASRRHRRDARGRRSPDAGVAGRRLRARGGP